MGTQWNGIKKEKKEEKHMKKYWWLAASILVFFLGMWIDKTIAPLLTKGTFSNILYESIMLFSLIICTIIFFQLKRKLKKEQDK